MGTMLPVGPAQGGQPGSYEGQLVSHIMQYINNLWRVDPSNFAATLNMICMRAPALMQRMMDHELAANAAVDQRFAQQQQQQQGQGSGTLAAMSSHPALPASTNPLQHPHELEVRINLAMCSWVANGGLAGDFIEDGKEWTCSTKGLKLGPWLLQAALSQLPLGDLNALLRYICQYMAMGPPAALPPTGPPLTDGTTTDVVRSTFLINEPFCHDPSLCMTVTVASAVMLREEGWLTGCLLRRPYLGLVNNAACMQGDWEEEQVCPPLFGFASPIDGDELESIADDVLGTDDDPRPSRCRPNSYIKILTDFHALLSVALLGCTPHHYCTYQEWEARN